MIPSGPWMNATETAVYLGLTSKFKEQTVCMWAKKGELKAYVRPGKKFLTKKEWCDKFIEARMK